MATVALSVSRFKGRFPTYVRARTTALLAVNNIIELLKVEVGSHGCVSVQLMLYNGKLSHREGFKHNREMSRTKAKSGN